VKHVGQRKEVSIANRDLLDSDSQAHGQTLISGFSGRRSSTSKDWSSARHSCRFERLPRHHAAGSQRDQWELDITEQGVVRQVCCNSFKPRESFSRKAGVEHNDCPFHAVFECRSPFAQDRIYTATSTVVSPSPTTLSFVQTGTAECRTRRLPRLHYGLKRPHRPDRKPNHRRNRSNLSGRSLRRSLGV